MKNIFLKLTYLAVFALVLASCEKEDYTGYSTANFVKPSATFSSTAGTNITVDESAIDSENGSTYTITATLSSASLVDTYIDLTKVSGTLGSDEFATESIYIPAQSLTGTGTVTIFQTGDVEGTETLQIKANANGHSANVTGNGTFNFTVNNDYINNVISFTFDWDGDYSFVDASGADITIHFSDIDYDFYLYDSDFNDMGIYDAASGSSPEHVDFSGLADGTYYIIVDIYDNPYAGWGTNQNVPITVSWEQDYFDSGSFVYNNFTTEDASGTELVAEITVTNGYVYTVSAL